MLNDLPKPVGRSTETDLRRFAKIFRDIFDVPQTGAFPVLEALERLPDVFDKSYYRVVENRKLSKKNPARCVLNKDGSFVIEIQKRIYDGAQKGIGAYLGFILHEILHIFMCHLSDGPDGLPAIRFRLWAGARRKCRGCRSFRPGWI